MKQPTKKILVLPFMILCLMSLVLADWEQIGGGYETTYNAPIEKNLNSLTDIQNFTISDQFNPPVAYDINQDGNDDLLSIVSNTLQTRLYNTTTQRYVLIDELNSRNMISSPFIIEQGGDVYIYGYSTTKFLSFNLTSDGQILFLQEKTLSNQITSKARQAGSVNCLTQFGTHCIMKENGSNYEIFNVTNPSSIIQTNYSSPILTDYTNNFKPTLYPNPEGIIPESLGVFFCNDTTKWGVALINIYNGSIYDSNCSINTKEPRHHAKVYDLDGGLKEIMFLTGMASTNDIVAVTSTLEAKSGFSLSQNTLNAGGFSFNGDRIYACWYDVNDVNIYEYSVNGVQTDQVENLPYGAPSLDSEVTTGNDFAYCRSYIWNLDDDTTTEISQTGGNLIVFQVEEEPAFLDTQFSVATFYRLGPQVVTYVNATLIFLNNVTKTSLGVVDFDIYQLGLKIGTGQTTQEGIMQIGNLLPDGEYNMSFLAQGFNPYYNNFTLVNGSKNYYFNASINESQSGNINVQLYDEETGLNLVNFNISVYLYVKNSSGTYLVLNSSTKTGNFTTNQKAGNYTFTFSDKDQYYQNFLGDEFLHVGVTNLEYGLGKVLKLVPTIPFISKYNTFSHTDTLTYSGDVERTQINNPPQTCVNQSFYINVTAIKKDNLPVQIIGNCALNDDPVISPTAFVLKEDYFPASTVYINKGLINCFYNESGNKTITLIARSEDYPYTLADFDTQVIYGAVQINHSVSGSCVGVPLIDLKNAQKDVDAIDDINSFACVVGVCNARMRLFVALTILVLLTIGLGVSGVALTQGDPQGLLIGGVAGFVFGLILVVFVLKWMPVFVAFVIGLICTAVVTFALKDTFRGG